MKHLVIQIVVLVHPVDLGHLEVLVELIVLPLFLVVLLRLQVDHHVVCEEPLPMRSWSLIS